MNWHIVTSSKGGIGKTLISMMVTKALIDKQQNTGKETLLLDINAMNPDSKNLLITPKEIRHSTIIKIPLGISCRENEEDELFLNIIQHSKYPGLYVAWLNETYYSFSPSSFFKLLEKLYEFIRYNSELANVCSVVVDTNYHIANLFSRKAELYRSNPIITELFTKNKFHLWFIWVYRQILNFQNNYRTNPEMLRENRIFFDVITQIEENLCFSNKHEPLVHVFTPVIFSKVEKAAEVLKTYNETANKQSIKDRLFDILENLFDVDDVSMVDEREESTVKNKVKPKTYSSTDKTKYIEIPCLKNIVELPISDESISFGETEANLRGNAFISEKEHRNKKDDQSQAFELFLENLGSSLKIDYSGRPKNIFPISTFEFSLIGHTDTSSFNLNNYTNYYTYKLFTKLFNSL